MTVPVLFLSYDGALDPLGRSQVVPYLEGLAGHGYVYDLLTFEKPERLRDQGARAEMDARLRGTGITWHPLSYHQRLSAVATAYDLYRGYRKVVALWPKRRWALVHSRSYPCTLIARRLRLRKSVPYIFDLRGFYPEERVDGGLWPRDGFLFKVAKAMETGFLRDASGVVTLTESSLPILRELLSSSSSRASVRVIPTSVDLDRFRPSPPGEREPFVLAYFGSLGTWYLLDEMLDLGRECLDAVSGSRLLFVVNGEVDRLRDLARGKGIPPDRLDIRTVTHEEIPQALQQASATFFLIKPAPSKVASAATKFGESLALGLPVLMNRGVGDSAAVVLEEKVGVVVEDFETEAYQRAVKEIRGLVRDPGIGGRCRRTAEDRYDLGKAVDAYSGLYQELINPGGGP